MIIDLFHNKIVKDTATEAFVESVNSRLVPMLEEKYGDSLERITMYEDYLADGLLFEGEWYYPLSVKLEGQDTATCWIKWPVSKKTFRNNVPYAYIGGGCVEFDFAGFVPGGFADKLQGRAIDYDRSAIAIRVEAVTDDSTLLVGKYSQTFVDELASQITRELCLNLGVESFEGSTMELQLVFAPGTYLEHTSENVTYRRLLLVDKGCQARDFWVKWTRLDGNGGFRVSDNVSAETVKFGLGEDVTQKIREKEYRFLAGANPSKYQAAMGKKNVTEWRDITKRALKRGDLVKAAPVVEPTSVPVVAPEAFDTRVQDDVNDQLRALLGSFGVATAATEEPVAEPSDDTDIFAALAKSVLETESEEDFEVEIEEIAEPEAEEETEEITAFAFDEDEAPFDVDEAEQTVEEVETAEETPEEVAPVEEEPEAVEEVVEPEIKSVFDFDFGITEEPEEEIFSMGEITLDEYENAVAAPVAEPLDADAIRREIEAKIRLEYETEARLRAEREAEQLRLEHERLREENERLAKLAREAEEKRAAEEEARRQEEEARRLAEEARQRELEAQKAEEERIRAEIEAKMRMEAEERARIAEAARMAVEEQKRLEAERAAKEERERLEALERESERLRREEEARRLEEARRQAEARRREEEEKRRREEEEAKARASVVTKQAKLLFRYTVDVNVLKRIKEVIEKTLVDNHKEKLNIHIKASQPDSNSIALEIKIPQNEMDILVSMMKALGGASLGITKIILE